MKTLGPILIVDDNPVDLRLLQSLVEGEGFSTNLAHSGNECLQICSATPPPALILLDLQMPGGLDGAATLEKIRAVFPREKLPVIFVTSTTSGEHVSRCFRLGANDYVTKPVDVHALMARIYHQLGLLKFQRSLNEARKKIEDSLTLQQALGDALPEALCVHDRKGHLVYQNQPLFLLGLGSYFETVFELFTGIYHGALSASFPAERLQAVLSGVQDVDEEVKISLQEDVRHISITSRPVLLSNDEVQRLWIFRDLTKVRILEEKLNQQVKMETVSLFASGVAHNFNNLFGSISGALQLLKRAGENRERFERCLQICEDAIQSGVQLTRKMYIARAQLKRDGSLEVPLFSAVTERVFSEVSALYAEKTVTLQMDPELEGLRVLIPTGALEAILLNLFENSFDALQERGNIVFSARSLKNAKGTVIVRMSDNGTGIEPTLLPRLCEPFFSTKKMDLTNKVSVQGKGLGLWNVYNIVRLAGGNLQFESEVGVGTQVLLELPVLSVDSSTKETSVAVLPSDPPPVVIQEVGVQRE